MESRLGELLVERGVLSSDQLGGALATRVDARECLAATLIRCGLVNEDELASFLSEALGQPRIELASLTIPVEVARLVSEIAARQHLLIPIRLSGRQLTVAMADPLDLGATNQIRLGTGYDVRPAIATPSAIKSAIEACLVRPRTDQPPLGAAPSSPQIQVGVGANEDAPVVRLIDALIARAIERGASDLHFEPYDDSFRVRYRIDGLLQEAMRPPVALKSAAISRLKVMASLNIAERRLPQDGRFRLQRNPSPPIDFRVSVLPTLHGEKIVLRVLDHSRVSLELDRLGFAPKALHAVRQALSQPHGLILVTGPTGSGKSSTLYAALASLNQIGRNVCTVEDPVELHLSGVNQVPVNEEVGMTFATSLRALLRQDPDVIMVGEIRDTDTATIAVRAALTGHLVLSTLHANHTAAAIVRLLDMGVPSFLVASALTLVIAQRLIRRLCPTCAALARPAADCPRCGGSGYQNRMALFEVMPVSGRLRTAIQQGRSANELRDIALSEGLETLPAAAEVACSAGLTDREEITRAIACEINNLD